MTDQRATADITRLVHEHHRSVFRYAFRLTGSDADAEDLAQQVFLVAHQKIGQVRDESKVRGWLFSVLRNCFLKSKRKQVPLPGSSLEMDLEQLPEVGSQEEIDSERLQQALLELPSEFRVVVVMFYFEQCSYHEIAEKLDIPLGTVMSRLSRAKGCLRRQLLPEQAHAMGASRAADTTGER